MAIAPVTAARLAHMDALNYLDRAEESTGASRASEYESASRAYSCAARLYREGGEEKLAAGCERHAARMSRLIAWTLANDALSLA